MDYRRSGRFRASSVSRFFIVRLLHHRNTRGLGAWPVCVGAGDTQTVQFRQPSEYGLTSSVTRDPTICVLFCVERFVFVPSGLFLLGCTAGLWRFGAFLPRSGGVWAAGAAASPLPASRAVLGPTVHLGAQRCRRTTGNKVPRTTWFLWVSESASERRYLWRDSFAWR